MSSTIAPTEQFTVALAQIDVEGNVRDELDASHVEDLAASIALRGLIVPLNVRPIDGGRYRLVAGFHRYAACVAAGLTEAPVTVRDREDASADTAAENILLCRPRRNRIYADGAGMPTCPVRLANEPDLSSFGSA